MCVCVCVCVREREREREREMGRNELHQNGVPQTVDGLNFRVYGRKKVFEQRNKL